MSDHKNEPKRYSESYGGLIDMPDGEYITFEDHTAICNDLERASCDHWERKFNRSQAIVNELKDAMRDLYNQTPGENLNIDEHEKITKLLNKDSNELK